MSASIPCEIQDIAYRGRGVARISGKAVFVPGVIRGEQVSIHISQRHKRYDEAVLAEIIHASPHRSLPFCKYYDQCPGCCYQHMTYEEELQTKNTQLKSLLRHVPNIGHTEFLPPTPSPRDRNYRNRITLHRKQTRTGPVTGYIAQDNRTIIPIETCPLADPQINEYIKDISKETDPAFSRVLLRKSGDNVVVMRDPDSSTPVITEHTALLGPLQVCADSFYQVNNALADLLLKHVSQLIISCTPDAVLDLYCGIGVFALLAGQVTGCPVTGIDNDSKAIMCARRNAERHNLSRICFKADTTTEALQNLPAKNGSNSLWIIDPPRTGLRPQARQQILEKNPENIIYISCAPDTLARDLQALCQSRYQLKQVRLFDMFPRTYCFETVTLLQARG